MDASYDIFRADPQGPVWIESVRGLTQAAERLEILSKVNPAEYFAYDVIQAEIVAKLAYEKRNDNDKGKATSNGE